jgi:hypothetical protein
VTKLFAKAWAVWFLWSNGYCFRHKSFEKIGVGFSSRKCRYCVREQDNFTIAERDRRQAELEDKLARAHRIVED